MPNIEIRKAEASQIDQIRQLILSAYAKWVPITPRKPRPMTADYSQSFERHRFDCLYIEGVLAALIETVRQDQELMIVNVAVEPDFQGRGFGSQLMRHAERLALEQGLSGTRLYTNKLMVENIRIYEKLGYRFERETHHDLGTIAVHMVRPLSVK